MQQKQLAKPEAVVRQAPPRPVSRHLSAPAPAATTAPLPDGTMSEARLPSDGRVCKVCVTTLSRKMKFDKKLQRYQRYYWCSTCAKESY